MSDDAPTQRLDASDPDRPVQPGAPNSEQRKSRGLLIALIVVGAALLIAIVVLLIVLLGGTPKPTAAATPIPGTSSATPGTSAGATPTSTSSPTTVVKPTSAPPPPSTKVAISGYSISPSQISCATGTPDLSIHWSSVNGKTAYFGVNTADAQTAGMGWELPPTGSDADFPSGYHPYPAICGQDTEYTITIVGTDGSKVSRMFTVKFKEN